MGDSTKCSPAAGESCARFRTTVPFLRNGAAWVAGNGQLLGCPSNKFQLTNCLVAQPISTNSTDFAPVFTEKLQEWEGLI